MENTISISIVGKRAILDCKSASAGSIPLGTSAQYLRGDKTWQTLQKSAVSGLLDTDSPSFASISTVTGGINIPTGQTYNINGVPHTHSNASIPNGSAANSFLVTGANPYAWAETTLASTKTILGIDYAGSSDFEYYKAFKVVLWGDSVALMAAPYIAAALPGYAFVNNGVGGITSTQVRTALVAGDYLLDYVTVIEGGMNGPDYDTVTADIAAMVAALGTNTRFLIIDLYNTPTEDVGTSPCTIKININNWIAATYPNNHIDTRSLVCDVNGNMPYDRTVDGLHLSATYNTVLGNAIGAWVLAHAPTTPTDKILSYIDAKDYDNFIFYKYGIGLENKGRVVVGGGTLAAGDAILNNYYFANAGGGYAPTGEMNIFIGRLCAGGPITTANLNVIIGHNSGYQLTTAAINTVVGNYSFYNARTSSGNSVFGTGALYTLEIGDYNTSVGYYSMASINGAFYCSAFGVGASGPNTAGLGTGTVTTNATTTVAGSGTSFNTQLTVGMAIKIGTEIRIIQSITNATTLIVTLAFAGSASGQSFTFGYNNWTAIGCAATCTASNQMVFGDSNVTSSILHGLVSVVGGGVNIPSGSTYNINGVSHTHTLANLANGTAEHSFLLTGATPFSWEEVLLADVKTALGLGSAAYTSTSAYEPALSQGSAGQYYRYDKTWQDLNQAAVAGLTTASAPTFAGLTINGTIARGANSITGTGDLGATGAGSIGNAYISKVYYNSTCYLDGLTAGQISGPGPLRLARTLTTARTDTFGDIQAVVTVTPADTCVMKLSALYGQVIVGASTKFSSGSVIQGLSFSGGGMFGQTGGSSNLDIYAADLAGFYGIAATMTFGTLCGCRIIPAVLAAISSYVTATNIYGLYLGNSTATTLTGTQTLLYVEAAAGATVANYQAVFAGTGAGSGIWFGGTTNCARVFASAASTLDLAISTTTILQLTATLAASTQDFSIAAAKACLWGAPSTDGSWQIIRSGSDIFLQRYDTNAWVTKQFLPSTPYRAITALRTLDTTDYFIDCTANSFTVTLPTAVGIVGKTYVIKNSGTGVILVVGTSSQTIDGFTTLSISTQYNSITVISDGANWKIV